jgi:hypothetical protein
VFPVLVRQPAGVAARACRRAADTTGPPWVTRTKSNNLARKQVQCHDIEFHSVHLLPGRSLPARRPGRLLRSGQRPSTTPAPRDGWWGMSPCRHHRCSARRAGVRSPRRGAGPTSRHRVPLLSPPSRDQLSHRYFVFSGQVLGPQVYGPHVSSQRAKPISSSESRSSIATSSSISSPLQDAADVTSTRCGESRRNWRRRRCVTAPPVPSRG